MSHFAASLSVPCHTSLLRCWQLGLGAAETVITYMSTLVAYHLDDPSSSVAGVLWVVASGVALVCFLGAEHTQIGPAEKPVHYRRDNVQA